jgi:hypothetical protein
MNTVYNISVTSVLGLCSSRSPCATTARNYVYVSASILLLYADADPPLSHFAFQSHTDPMQDPMVVRGDDKLYVCKTIMGKH